MNSHWNSVWSSPQPSGLRSICIGGATVGPFCTFAKKHAQDFNVGCLAFGRAVERTNNTTTPRPALWPRSETWRSSWRQHLSLRLSPLPQITGEFATRKHQHWITRQLELWTNEGFPYFCSHRGEEFACVRRHEDGAEEYSEKDRKTNIYLNFWTQRCGRSSHSGGVQPWEEGGQSLTSKPNQTKNTKVCVISSPFFGGQIHLSTVSGCLADWSEDLIVLAGALWASVKPLFRCDSYRLWETKASSKIVSDDQTKKKCLSPHLFLQSGQRENKANINVWSR